jgi:nucleotide-binding universal stress UspA family protein
MADEHVVVVAIEDLATIGAVCAEAVRRVAAQENTVLYLVHVLDEHPVLRSMLGSAGTWQPVEETDEECNDLLSAAREVLVAEFAALGQAAPRMVCVVEYGAAGEALARVVAERQAEAMVIGARRPHLFGRLTHADVGAHLQGRVTCAVHVAPLQAASPE